MTDTRTFRVVDEDGDYYETVGDPVEAFERACAERDKLAARVAELETERDRLAAELRWIDEQGTDAADLALVQARALTDNGNRTPLADVTAEFGMKPACNHGPDMQCIECVPDDGVSFRFQPLGGTEDGV